MPFVWGIFVLMLVLVFHVDETVGKCELMPEQYKGGNSYDCSNSGLESFPSRLFAKNTTSIDFSRNALTVLAWNEFENLTNLTYLDVSQNMISNVAKDAFLNLQLETLLFGANIMACDFPRNLINCFNCTVQSQTLESNHTNVALTECGDHQYYECRYDLYPVYCNDTFCANGGELKVGRICECNYFYTGIHCDDFDTSKTWFIVFMLLLGCCYYGPETCKICGKCECPGGEKCAKCLIGCLGVLVAIVLFPKRMIGKARGSIKAGQQRRRSVREAREAFVKRSAQFSEATPLQIQTLGGDMYSVVDWGLVRSIVDELKKQHPDTFGEEIVTLMYDGNFNKPDVDETELVPFVDAPFNLKLIKGSCDLKVCQKCTLIARGALLGAGDWGDRCITGGGDRGDLIDRKIPTSMIALFGVQVQVQDQDQDLIQPPPPSYASQVSDNLESTV